MKKKCLVLSVAIAVVLCVFALVYVNRPKDNTDDERQRYLEDVLSQELPDEQDTRVRDAGDEVSSSNSVDPNFDKKLEQKIEKDIDRLSWTEAYRKYDALSDEQKSDYSGAIPSKYKVSMDALDDIVAFQEGYDLESNIKKNEEAASNNPTVTRKNTTGTNQISSGIAGVPGLDDGGGIGSHPSPSQPINATVEYDENGLPDSYDLRNVMEMSIDDQKQVGLCWDFASTNSMESFMFLHGMGNINLSEVHANVLTSQFFYGLHSLDDGGDFESYSKYLALSGVAEEFDSEYSPVIFSDYYKPAGGESPGFGAPDYKKYPFESYYERETINTHITKTIAFPSLSTEDKKNMTDDEIRRYRSAIKRHIIENGSLYFSVSVACINNIEGYIYCRNDDDYIPHAMSIIGWIDDFDNSYMTDSEGYAPENRGVYIVKNSWGEDDESGYGQYYYMPYDTFAAEEDIHGIASNSIEDATRISDFKGEYFPNFIRSKYNQYINEIDGQEYFLSSAIDLSKIKDYESFSAEDYDDLAMLGENVRTLEIVNYQNVNVDYLKNFPNVSTLILENVNALSEDTLAYIVSKVSSLTIKDANLNSSNFLANSGSIVFLEFENVSGLDISLIPTDGNLQSLKLKGCTNVSGLDNIRNIQHLYSLNLDSMGLNSVTDLRLSDSTSLMTISLAGNKITDFSGLSSDYSLLDLSDNSLEEYPASVKAEMLKLDSNHISEITNVNEKTHFIQIANNQAVITRIDINNSEVWLDIKDSEIAGFEAFDGVSIGGLYLTNNNLSSIPEINASINNIQIKDNPSIANIGNLKNIRGLRTLRLDNAGSINFSDLNSLEELTSIAFSGGDISGRYSGGAKTITITNDDISKLKLASDCNIRFLSLGDITEKDLRRIKSANAMDREYSEINYGSGIITMSENEFNNPDTDTEKYSFFYSDDQISPTQIIKSSVGETIVNIPVSANQKEYIPGVTSRMQRVIFNDIGKNPMLGENLYYGKNSVKTNDVSLAGKEYSTSFNDEKVYHKLKIRFVEAD